MASDPIATRDSGLRRVSRITRSAFAGALVLAGALSALAARELPGRTSPPAGNVTRSHRGTSLLPPSGSATAPGFQAPSGQGTAPAPLQPPVSAPVAGSGGGPVTSGGS
ncbi:MAG TPA: hypothetical protein VEM41_04015 [Actinomycetota bacterium]|nr:hypothetical protein [Actinomycetota bacterium]